MLYTYMCTVMWVYIYSQRQNVNVIVKVNSFLTFNHIGAYFITLCCSIDVYYTPDHLFHSYVITSHAGNQTVE